MCVSVCLPSPSAFHPVHAVRYATDNFLGKNKDYVVAEHAALLAAAQAPLVNQLFGAGAPGGGSVKDFPVLLSILAAGVRAMEGAVEWGGVGWGGVGWGGTLPSSRSAPWQQECVQRPALWRGLPRGAGSCACSCVAQAALSSGLFGSASPRPGPVPSTAFSLLPLHSRPHCQHVPMESPRPMLRAVHHRWHAAAQR